MFTEHFITDLIDICKLLNYRLPDQLLSLVVMLSLSYVFQFLKNRRKRTKYDLLNVFIYTL